MSNHAPGPWQITQYTNYHGWSVCAEGHGCIAERWYPAERSAEENQIMEATSRLIAAAPDMLEALKLARNRMSHRYDCGWQSFEGCQCEIRQIEAAIAKAEGREESR